MADELGNFEVGVLLQLADLKVQVSTAAGLLKEVEGNIQQVATAAKTTASAVTGLGASMVVWNNALQLGRTILAGAQAGFHMLEGAVHKVYQEFEHVVLATGDWAEHLGVQAAMVGDSVEHFRALDAGMQVFTGGMGSATTALRFLGRNLQTVAAGETMNAKKALKELGVEAVTTDGYMKTSGQVLDELAPKFAAMADGPHKTAIAMALFGRFGATMIPLLNEIGASGKNVVEYFKQFGIAASADTLRPAQELHDVFEIINMQLSGFSRNIGLIAAPAFIRLGEEIRASLTEGLAWVSFHRSQFADAANSIGAALQGAVVAAKEWARTLPSIGPTIMDLIVKSVMGLVEALAVLIKGLAGVVTAASYLKTVRDILSGMDAATAWANYGKLGEALNQTADGLLKMTAGARQHEAVSKMLNEHLAQNIARLRAATPASAEYQHALGRVTASLEVMKKSNAEYTTSNELALSSLGLLAEGLNQTGRAHEAGGTKVNKHGKETEKATKAIQDMIRSLEQEQAALLGGEKAKLEAILSSDKFAAASEEDKNKVRALSEQIDNLKFSLEQLKPALAMLDPDKMRTERRTAPEAEQKRAADAALALAKAYGTAEDVKRAEYEKSRVEMATSTADQLAKEEDAIHELEILYTELGGEKAKAILADRMAHDEEVRNFKGTEQERIDFVKAKTLEEISIHERAADSITATYRAQADAAIREYQRQIDEMNRMVIDASDVFTRLTNDIFAGPILGTKKWADTLKDAWQAVVKEIVNDVGKILVQYALMGEAPMPLFKVAGKPVTEAAGGLFGLIFGGAKKEMVGPPAPPAAGGSPAVAGVASAAQESFATRITKPISDAFEKALIQVQKTLGDLLANIGTKLSQGWTLLSNGLRQVWDGLSGILGPILKQVWSVLGDILKSSGGVLEALLGPIVAWLANLAAAMWAKVAEFWETGGMVGGVHSAAAGMYTGSGAGPRGIPIIAHPFEGILNARATANMGGERTIHALNRGASLQQVIGLAGRSVSDITPSPARGGAGGASATFAPGSVIINVPSGDPHEVARHFADGVMRRWNR